MKYIILIILTVFTLTSYSQKKTGYGQVSASGFISEKYDKKFGISASGGVGVSDLSSIGAGVDFYVLKGESSDYAQLYGDFRFYFSGLSKEASPFIAFQPGMVLYNKRIGSATTKGGFAVNGLAGFFVRSKKGIGGIVSLGVSHITFSTGTDKTSFTGFKVTGGVLF